MKVAIGIPTSGTITIETFTSIVNLLKVTPCEVLTQTSSILHENRNILAEKAIKTGCTHLLFVDSDMKFEPDLLVKLLKRGKDIIGVVSCARKLPLSVTAKKLAEGYDIWERHGELTKCAGVGTGVMLINLEVFKKLTKPYFFYEHKEDGSLDYGEDMYFCRKAREAGYDIWLDTTISVGHIGSYNYQMQI